MLEGAVGVGRFNGLEFIDAAEWPHCLDPSAVETRSYTIHFVKWLLIDDGRRLMMVSDYDGSWESYIDEFAEMILSGLDAIWETSCGYPPDGARDLPAFKRFLRSHQVPAEIFFSAYPEETVLNVVGKRFRPLAADQLAHRSRDFR